MVGIKLQKNKKKTIYDEIVDVSNPNRVYIPLIINNKECECLTKKGRKVKKGAIIGINKSLDFPILSTVSGEVLEIKEMLYINNKMVKCVVIRNDKKEDEVKKKIIEDITTYSKEGFVETIKKCGVVGMGGSGFPTYLKYIANIDILIVNAVECEPYITSDLMLTKLKSDIILETIDAIMKINNIKKCFIAYKKNNRQIYKSFLKHIDKYENIFLVPVKDIYPMGWERYIVDKVLKLKYDRYPSEVGVVVNNVSTIFAIYKALKFQRPITKRIITISGEEFIDPINVLVKIGTKFSNIVKKVGDYKATDVMLIAGGPMMGTSLKSDSVIIPANLNAILALPKCDDEEHNCIECGKCLNVCPAGLSPVFIMKNRNDKDKLKELHPEKCCECGLCSYICPSKINLRDYVVDAKKEVK